MTTMSLDQGTISDSSDSDKFFGQENIYNAIVVDESQQTELTQLYNNLKKDFGEKHLAPIQGHIKSLIDADKSLHEVFKKLLDSDTYSDADKILIKNLNYQLFRLQINIIFDKSKKLQLKINELYELLKATDSTNAVYVKRVAEQKKLIMDLIEQFERKIKTLSGVIDSRQQEFAQEEKRGKEQLLDIEAKMREAKRQADIEASQQLPTVPKVPEVPKIPEVPKSQLAPLPSPKQPPKEESKEAERVPDVPSGLGLEQKRQKDSGSTDPLTPRMTQLLSTDIPGIDVNSTASLMKSFNDRYGGILTSPAQSDIDTTIRIINAYTNLLNIMNTSNYLKFMTLLYNKEDFVDLLAEIGITGDTNMQVLNLFFIDITKIKNQIKLLGVLGNEMEHVIDRDTKIYKMYFGEAGQVILLYKLLSSINNYVRMGNKVTDLFSTKEKAMTLFHIFDAVVAVEKPIIKLYDFLSSKISTLDKLYNKLLSETKKVYTYTRLRKDQGKEQNKRYFIKKHPNENVMFIKYYNTDEKNVLETKGEVNEEFYYLGPYDGIFDSSKFVSNKAIAESEEIKPLIDKLRAGSNVCVIGYGQSGSGKTSSLIYLETPTGIREEGIIVEMCRRLGNNPYDFLTITMTEIMAKYDSSASKDFKSTDYIVQDIALIPNLTSKNTKYQFAFKKDNNGDMQWIGRDAPKELFEHEQRLFGKKRFIDMDVGNFIITALKYRKVEPTANNSVSSRSHVIIDIHLGNTGKLGPHLIICDLAGVENKFKCDNPSEAIRFFNKYKEAQRKDVNFINDNCDVTLLDKKHMEKLDSVIGNNNRFAKIFNTYKVKQGGGACKGEIDINCDVRQLSITPEDYANINQAINENIRDMSILFILKYYAKHPNELKGSHIAQLTREINQNIDEKVSDENLRNKIKLTIDTGKDDRTIKLLEKKFEVTRSGKISGTVDYYTKQRATLKNKLHDNICIYNTMNKIKFNCDLRINEGYMINKSLSDLRNDIATRVMGAIKRGQAIEPLVYFTQEIPYCADMQLQYNYYDTFYKPISTRPKNKLMDIIEGFTGSAQDITFAIFTVVNVSDDVNNPPSIPYIDINALRYFYSTYTGSDRIAKLELELQKITKNLQSYKYYVESYPGKSITKTKNTDEIPQLLDEIDRNNASSLIGSLEATEKLKSLFSSGSIGSYQEYHREIIEQYKKFGVELSGFIINDVPLSAIEVNALINKNEKNKSEAFILRDIVPRT